MAKAAAKPLWLDEDDENVEVNIAKVGLLRKHRRDESENTISGKELSERLHEQHRKLHKGTDWADIVDPAAESDSDEEGAALLRSAAPLLGSSAQRLPPAKIDISGLPDANKHERSSAVVQHVTFHPNAPVLLTCGLDKSLRLFQVDGRDNPKLQGVFMPDLPVCHAEFINGGSQIIAAGRRKWFYVYDVERGAVEKIPYIIGRSEKSLETFAACPQSKQIAFLGNDGAVILVSSQTKQWIANLKLADSVRCATFSADGNTLVTSGGEGQIYHWDMRTRKLLYKHADEGSMYTTTVAVSPNGKHLASGQQSGVVNVYDLEQLYREQPRIPTPTKALLNLTTPVDSLVFNPDSQILAMSSHGRKNALRLVHLPSCTVFNNWPTERTPLNYVSCVTFSPNSGYMVVGNDKGRALLYRVKHYSAA
eukprot:TRINITY_DN15223_c0_g1_i1.p1 TRINITY_DN15223_c0_g1~~TRINITY_DN15223_c0_g1_i1.p1  ORF type:complete len:434 (+),score=76.02 TRINITY_DN15223_c0_g1_i1:37-1302(+)